MYPVLRPILGRGGAGKYITRAESVERLLPYVPMHHRLLHAYDYTLERMRDDAGKERLLALMPLARTEAGKLSETIFSLGGTPSNGTNLEPGETGVGSADAEMLHHVADMERAYHDALLEEVDAVHHQERTRSILQAVATGSAARLEAIREITNRLPRPARD